MSKPMTPELKKLLDKRISVKLNAKRVVSGRLRGFDHFLNLVLDEAVEDVSASGERREIGTIVIRGNSIVEIQALERVGGPPAPGVAGIVPIPPPTA